MLPVNTAFHECFFAERVPYSLEFVGTLKELMASPIIAVILKLCCPLDVVWRGQKPEVEVEGLKSLIQPFHLKLPISFSVFLLMLCSKC